MLPIHSSRSSQGKPVRAFDEHQKSSIPDNIYKREITEYHIKHVREANKKRKKDTLPPKKSNARHTGILPSNSPKTIKKKTEKRREPARKGFPPEPSSFPHLPASLLKSDRSLFCSPTLVAWFPPKTYTHTSSERLSPLRKNEKTKTLAEKPRKKRMFASLPRDRDRQRPSALVYCPPAQCRNVCLLYPHSHVFLDPHSWA